MLCGLSSLYFTQGKQRRTWNFGDHLIGSGGHGPLNPPIAKAPLADLPSGTPARDTGTACQREFHARHKGVTRHQPTAPADTPAGEKNRFFCRPANLKECACTFFPISAKAPLADLPSGTPARNVGTARLSGVPACRTAKENRAGKTRLNINVGLLADGRHDVAALQTIGPKGANDPKIHPSP